MQFEGLQQLCLQGQPLLHVEGGRLGFNIDANREALRPQAHAQLKHLIQRRQPDTQAGSYFDDGGGSQLQFCRRILTTRWQRQCWPSCSRLVAE